MVVMSSYVQDLIDVYRRSPFNFGDTDICSDDSRDPIALAGAFAFVMNQVQFAAEKSHVSQVLVIAPPSDADGGLNEIAIRRSTIAAAEDYFKRTLTREELDAVDRYVKVFHTRDMKMSSAMEALKNASEDSAVIILYAASYRDERVPQPPLPESKFLLREDFWMGHFLQLARNVTQVAASVPCYALIDTGERSPLRLENREALKEVPNSAVFAWRRERDPEALVMGNIERWGELVETGRIGSAFASVDALPEWMNPHKSFLKLQLIEAITPGHEVPRLLRSELKVTADPSARLKLSRIALRADDDDLVREVLSPAIAVLIAKEDLEAALDIATKISDPQLMTAAVGRLKTLFPDSQKIAEHRLTELFQTRRYAELLEIIDKESAAINPELVFFFRTLSSAFLSSDTPQYALAMKVIEQTTPALANWARTTSVREALCRREFKMAIELCMPTEDRVLTSGTANILLHAVRELLLQRDKDGKQLLVNGEQLTAPVAALIEYLSLHPADGKTREHLASLLSVETSGRLGLAVILVVTHRLAGSTFHPPAPSQGGTMMRPVEELTSIIRNVVQWLEKESPVILGVTKLPKTLLTAPADEIFDFLRSVIKSDQDLRGTLESKTFDYLFMTAVLIAPYTSTPDEDLDVLRFAAARYIAANQPQRGRDYAEQALQLAGESPERKRLAWFAFADIYHRSRMFLEALIGIACAFAVKIGVSFEQMWEETYLLIRILRDLHFTEHALAALAALRQVIVSIEPAGRYELRAKTLELGIRMVDPHRRIDRDAGLLTELTEQITRHSLEVLASEEDVTPAATLLAQCIYLSLSLGLPLQENAISALNQALPKVPKALATLIHAVSSRDVGIAELLLLAKTSELARNTEDIAYDLKTAAVVARRFLDSSIQLDKAAEAIFAIEVLADQALRGSTDSPFSSVQTPANLAFEVSRLGLGVMFLGRSESSRVVRVDVAAGAVESLVYEEETVFSATNFHKWSLQYPHAYAAVSYPSNVFYMSMKGIGVSTAPTEPTVLIMDNSLQQLPPNLILMEGELAGRLRPMASAPSISWLWSTMGKPSHKGKRKAWISTELEENKKPALITVAERLRHCLGEYDISLETRADIPEDMNDSELIVVAAHGGILPEGRFIQRLSDDASLTLHPSALAGAVNGSSVVILFVCSGGRVDPHPNAETTVGLVKSLLDQGCCSVVASPWPLDTRIPSHWLPTFLREWTSGRTIIEANYLANKNVEKELGDCPSDCLAMNVFGDPYRVKA
jgi:hypothetical protein